MTKRTRRAFLASTAASLSLAGCLGGDDAGSDTATPSNKTPLGSETPVDDVHVGDQPTGAWHQVPSPTAGTLYDVVKTAHGLYAVGENGVILTRCNGVWEVIDKMALEVTGNALYDAGTSGDGRTLWFAGSSGAIGAYEPRTQELLDYSAPDGKTSTWEAVAVAGRTGDERVFVANGSGELVRGKRDGKEIDWIDVHEPGSGSSFSALTYRDGAGYLADTGGDVFRTTDDGDDWDGFGIRGGSADLFDVGVAGANTVYVSASGGAVYRYNGTTWTQLQAGSADVHGLSVESRTAGLACTGEGGVYALEDGTWEKQGQPTDGGLQSVEHGSETSPQVAVGGSGTIVEQFPAQDGS